MSLLEINIMIYCFGVIAILILKRFNSDFNPPHCILIAVLWPIFAIAIILDILSQGFNKLWKF